MLVSTLLDMFYCFIGRKRECVELIPLIPFLFSFLSIQAVGFFFFFFCGLFCLPMSRKFTAEELSEFTGVNGKPIYISVKGVVYDCSEAVEFYGEGKPYAVFAGKESSRSLAKMLIDDTEANAGWNNLNESHMKCLDEWVEKYKSKYPVVGTFQPDPGFLVRAQQLEP